MDQPMADTFNPYVALAVASIIIGAAAWFTFRALWRSPKNRAEYWIYVRGVRYFGLPFAGVLYVAMNWNTFPNMIVNLSERPLRAALAIVLGLLFNATGGMWVGFFWGLAMSKRMTGGH